MAQEMFSNVTATKREQPNFRLPLPLPLPTSKEVVNGPRTLKTAPRALNILDNGKPRHVILHRMKSGCHDPHRPDSSRAMPYLNER